jgi:excisionase family DNA binding protein
LQNLLAEIKKHGGKVRIEIRPYVIVEKEPDLLGLAAAAEYLGMTTRKLKDVCRDKRITHDRIDYRTYRFTRENLDKFLSEYRMHAQ